MLNFDKPFNPQATLDDVVYAYRLFLRRHPDDEGFQHYRKSVETGLLLENLARGFSHSTEYRDLMETEEKVTTVEIEGRYMYARLGDEDVGGQILKARQYEPHVTKILSGLLKNGHTFVDIGANIGYFTILAASIVGGNGRVIAVEPNPDNIQLLLASIVKNGYKNVRVLPFAASDRESVFELVVGGSNGYVVDARNPNQHSVYTQSIILDEQLSQCPNIDVVKMDVEGHEPNVLAGLKGLLRKHLPTMVAEFHPKALRESKNDPEEYLSELFDLYKSVSIILREGGLRKCRDTKDVTRYWAETDEIHQMNGAMHLDLIAFSE